MHSEKLDRWSALAGLFSKLGILGFGGPVAHLAAIEREVVEARQWLDKDRLLDLIGIANLLPGPTSTQVVFQIGYLRGGIIGAAIAGVCFILPGALIVWLLAIGYVKYQELPQLITIFDGLKPPILAGIIYAVYRLMPSAITDRVTAVAALVVLIIGGYFNGSQIGLLILAGLGVMLWQNRRSLWHPQQLRSIAPLLLILTNYRQVRVSLFELGWIFIKIGSVVYGGGYVLYGILQQELVERHQLLTAGQLLDGIAIGQVTPGPLFTTATFIGYLLAGNIGAIVATLGIFLPGFILVIILMPIVPKLQTSPWFKSWLNGVKAGSFGLMAIVAIKLAATTWGDALAIGLTMVNLLLIWRFQVDLLWLIIAGAIGNFILQALSPIIN
jgi:chromate transporter